MSSNPSSYVNSCGIRLSFLVVVISIVASAAAFADPIARSGPFRVTLLELYSSEGCSSCPGAEAWLSRRTEDPALWRDFVPVVFHVDYWDYLGWKDRFSRPQYTARQRQLGQFWRATSIYTPEFYLNGREWRDWHRQDAFPSIVREEAGQMSLERIGTDIFRVSIRPSGTTRGVDLRFHAAILVSGIVTDVKAGENAGRRLRHDFAVAEYASAPSKPSGNGTFEADIRMSVPEEFKSATLSAVAWVTSGENPVVLQAVGGYL